MTRLRGYAHRTAAASTDLRLNPHLHLIALDGTWREKDGELAWEGLGHLRTSDVGEVLERLVWSHGALSGSFSGTRVSKRTAGTTVTSP